VRLGIQGVEMLTTGRVTLPIAEPDRTWLCELRHGEHTMAESIERATELEARLMTLKDSADLPPHPDYAWANKWLTGVYRREWQHAIG
jgi:hypothetical protein